MKYKNILIGILCSILIVYVSKILYATASSTELENYNLIALSSTKQVSTKEYDADIDDIIVGTSSRNSSYTARDYVIFGNRQIGVSGNLELSTINGSNGFIITGDGDDEALRFVSNAGDVNDDGIDDIILGASRAGESNAEYGTDSIVSGDPPSGRGYVIFGSRNDRDRAEIKLSNLDGSNGFLMEIDAPGGHLGRSVSGAGDINADGIDDIIIGSSFVGSYIIFGDRNLGSNGKIDVSSLNGTQGFALLPFKSFLGHSVSSAGDLNADGISDLAIVAAEPKTRTSKNNTNSSANNSRTVVEGGIAYVIYGSANIEHLQEQDLFLMNRQQGLILQDYGSYLGFIFSTTQFDKSTHKSISNLGDVNGDGIDDLIVGIPGASNRADSYVIFGNRQYGANANANDK